MFFGSNFKMPNKSVSAADFLSGSYHTYTSNIPYCLGALELHCDCIYVNEAESDPRRSLVKLLTSCLMFQRTTSGEKIGLGAGQRSTPEGRQPAQSMKEQNMVQRLRTGV